MTVRLLLVEDDPSLASVLKDTLAAAGHAVTWVGNGNAAVNTALAARFDLIVLDVVLPGCSGFDVCKRLRDEACTTPILMLTARDSRDDRIHGLTLGADDYLTKPFDPEELLARLHALLRRSQARNSELVLCRFGEVSIHFLSGVVMRKGERVFLSTKELQLLHYLVTRPGLTLSRAELLREVWGCGASLTRTVDMHMATLRQKLEENPRMPRHLLTVRGEGYRFQLVKDSLPQQKQHTGDAPRSKSQEVFCKNT